jgi:hypothetical protein
VEAGEFRIVHHVGQDAPGRRRRGHRPIDRRIVGGGDHQPRLVQPIVAEFAGTPADATSLLPSLQPLAQFRGSHHRQRA